MTIYDELIERVSNGETFHIDFEKRNMKIGREFLIKNGEYDTSRVLCYTDDMPIGLELIIGCINVLYSSYRVSLPSKRSDQKKRTYFKALPIEEISDTQLMKAERREVAQARLEGYILCVILEKKFVWNEDTMGKWFWQSKGYPDLVILKKWIEKGE